MFQLEETENDIKKRNEALQIVTLQFNVEKKSLTEEITKCKKELNDLAWQIVKTQMIHYSI